MKSIPSRHALVATVGLCAAASVATAGMSYTPLAFGPLTDPGGNRYYTQVADISADGMSYVGVLDNFDVTYVYQGTTYDVRGTGGPFAISPDGRTAVGGIAGEFAQRWDVDNASAGGIVSTDIQAAADFFVTQPAYGTNSSVSAFSISTPTGVLTGDGFKSAEEPFGPQDPLTFAGANRGIAVDAPVAVVLGFQPDVNASGYRWNYETNELTPLINPGSESAATIGGIGSQISGDASVIGGSASPTDGIKMPYYWDESGTPHSVPTVGDRIFGSVQAVNYTGTLLGGNIFGAGLDNHAFLYDPASGTSWDLNELFANVIPDGWILTSTTHISNDGSRIFATALAPDGSQRAVELEGDFVPTPGTLAMLSVGGLAMTRRRR